MAVRGYWVRWNWAACAALAMGLWASPARATVVFNFTYFDVTTSTGSGFDDPVLGAARRAALEATAAEIGARIGQSATLEVGVAPSQTDGADFIGIAVATFNDTSPGIRDGEAYRRIVLGAPDTPGFEGSMAYDFGYPMTLSGPPTPGVSYFPDIVWHEITHMLGYGSFISPTGTGFNNTAPDMYTRFDSFVTTYAGPSTGLDVIDSGGNLLLDSPTYAFAYANGFAFDGPATRAANGGSPLRLYPGSPTHSFVIGDIMYPSPVDGFAGMGWSAVDVAVLTDLGYEIVPEPSTWALSLFGFLALFGFLCRQRLTR